MSKAARAFPQFNCDGGLPANGVTIESEVIAGNFVSQRLRFINVPVTVANTTGASFGSVKIFDFPLGKIYIIGGGDNFTFDWSTESIVQTGSGDYSIGTTATADATLSSTDANIQASTAMLDPFVAGLGTGAGSLASPTEHDGKSTAKDAYLNIIIDDADVSNADTDIVLVSGYLDWNWVQNGIN